MENGGLADRLLDLSINEGKDNSLFQVMKAVEAAEATIKQQVEENNRLRSELQKKEYEVEALRLDKSMAKRYHSVEHYDDHGPGSNSGHQSTMMFDTTESHSGFHRSNGTLNTPPSNQTADNAGLSQFSALSAAPFSPGRYPMDGEHDLHLRAGQGLLPVAESNDSNHHWKQQLVQKIREHEEEITQLRKHLTEYSVKETQICNEKHVLEKRIAHMRMAFDQQQQDLVDAASKALSYRQDIIEENVRLTYALQDAQQERATFVSSLLPLLAEYSLQPPVPDAQSIVSNVKVLFKHLQEKLIITEAKLKEFQYQVIPWRSDGSNPHFAPQSPQHSSGAALTSGKNGLELVQQPTYSPVNMAIAEARMATEWDLQGHHAQQAVMDGAVVRNTEIDDMGRYSPLASRDSPARDVPSQVHDGVTHSRQVKFKDPVSSSETDGTYVESHHNEREHDPGPSPHSNTFDEPSTSYPAYLQPVAEEPSSSFSEAADDDPLPAIDGLQISGDAFPGRELQACGYSIHGTTSCNFEWVRHLQDGSVNYIDGAKQPTYLVTADDVDTYLAIEVQPLDDRKRKGDLVKVFANEQKKIVCDPAMQSHIEKNLYNGHASYKVSLSTGYLDIWEPATLTIKREGYSIKCSGPSGVAVNEKLTRATTVTLTYGHDTEFSIISSNSVVHLLRADNSISDISSLRDAIVLTLRLFIMKAGEKRKVKKRSLFFNK